MTANPSELLPHGPRAVLVETILAHDDTSLHCVARIPSTSSFGVDGSAPTYLAIEICAQAAALHQAITGGSQRRAKGLLAQVSSMSLDARPLRAESPCEVTVRRRSQAFGFASWTVSLSQDGRVAAEGNLTTFIDSDVDAR